MALEWQKSNEIPELLINVISASTWVSYPATEKEAQQECQLQLDVFIFCAYSKFSTTEGEEKWLLWLTDPRQTPRPIWQKTEEGWEVIISDRESAFAEIQRQLFDNKPPESFLVEVVNDGEGVKLTTTDKRNPS